MAGKIAYIMSRFPHLPETFILREMNVLVNMGWEIALYPLILQNQAVVHRDAEPWLERVHYTPFLSWDVISANVRQFVQMPGRYLSTIFKIIFQNITNLKFLLRGLVLFPKAVFMASRMEAEGVQHIHAHYASHPALVAWVIHQFSRMSYSVTVHAHDIFVVKEMLATKLSGAEFIVAISEFNRRFLGELIGKKIEDKTHIIHCGVDPSWYQSQDTERYDPNERFEIINVSSLQPYKGQIYLLKACKLLKEHSIEFRCRIIGEGQERHSLESYIKEHGLQKQVLLLGALSQEEVAKLLPSAHCYVQPSVKMPDGKMEGIPVALMEAFASGLPVVATQISGIPELVQPKITGFLVSERNPTALADALQTVYHDLDHANTLAQAGFDLVQAEYELGKNVNQLSKLFNQVTSQ